VLAAGGLDRTGEPFSSFYRVRRALDPGVSPARTGV